MVKLKFKNLKNTVLLGLFEGVYYKHFLNFIADIIWMQSSFKGEYFSRKYFMQVSILTELPLVAVLKLISPHLNLHDFSEKTKPFYCPSGANFSTKSKDLRLQIQSECSLNSSCNWKMSNGCSAPIFKTLMNKRFEVPSYHKGE